MRKVIPRDAKLIPSNAERVFEGIIFDVYQWQQQMYNGKTATFEMLRRPDTVVIMPVKDGKLVMLDEEQPHYGRELGFPGGRNDVEGEDELACAKREMLEETGMTFKTWRLLDVYQTAYKIEHFVYTFLATDFISQTDPKVDGGEDITVQLVTFEECLNHSKTEEGKYLPKALLKKAGSLEGLLALPEYKA
jgi:ADP-ribose pyrophosphatase